MGKFKKIFERNKPHCNIGTIGHVDHGKTTLTAAITYALSLLKDTNTVFKSYADIDSNAEEQRRGITINAAHIEYETKIRHYSHIDCPGHQDYIKNMITGASQMDGVILVVSAYDGCQVQTREHVILAREIGIPYMVVYVNKLDRVSDKDIKMLIEFEIRELIEQYSFPDSVPFSFGSATIALKESMENNTELGLQSIYDLMNNIDIYIKDPPKLLDSPFIMPIESVFSIVGRGTVVSGKIEKGIVKIGDNLDIIGKKLFNTTCMGLEMFRRSLEYGQVGDNIGILVKNVDKKLISRGYIICKSNIFKAYKTFESQIYILSKEEGGRKTPFSSNYKPQFFFRTSNITGSVTILNQELGIPGEHVTIKVDLVEPSAIENGLRFVIREGKLTIGAGVITKVLNTEIF